MTVIRASVLHAPVLAALRSESFKSAWDDDTFAKLLSQPGVAAWIWQDERPRGFILVRAAADEAEIVTLAVSPAHRRKGIGATLIDAAVAQLSHASIKNLFLEVAADNAAARALYAAANFSECGQRPGYYQDRDGRIDAVIMKRPLA